MCFESLTVDMERLDKNLLLLKGNEENVGKEILMTKYKKPYEKLKKEIWTDTVNFTLLGCSPQANIPDDAVMAIFKRMQDTLIPAMKKAVFEEYSVDRLCDEVQPLWDAVKTEVVIPAVTRYTKAAMDPKGNQSWYNSYLNLWWHEKVNAWVRYEEDGSISFPLYWKGIPLFREERAAS